VSARAGTRRGLIVAALVVVISAAAFIAVVYLRAPSTDWSFGVISNPDDAPEDWRYEPMRDVRVVVVWLEDVPRDEYPSTRQRCLRSEYTRTRDDGTIHLDGWWMKPRWPLVRKIRVVHLVAEPGYGRELWNYKNWVPMFNSTAARDEDPSNPAPLLTPRGLLGCLEPPIEER
jgi:hypothetical protein